MKSFRSVLAAISITWAILFSCRVVMFATPLNMVEQITLCLAMVEFSLYKTKELEIANEEAKKKDGQNDK